MRVCRRTSSAASGQGFTLIEVLATLVLIAIVLPAAMRGVSISTAAGSNAKRNLEAVSLCQTKLNELVASGQNISNLSGDFGPDWSDYHWIARSTTRELNLVEVNVQVVWADHGTERSISLSTLLYTSGQGVNLP